jgi:hypothetical protein
MAIGRRVLQLEHLRQIWLHLGTTYTSRITLDDRQHLGGRREAILDRAQPSAQLDRTFG